MKVHHVFYALGVFFIFASVWYFSREFIMTLPNEVKTVLLIFSVIITFSIAEIFRGFDK